MLITPKYRKPRHKSTLPIYHIVHTNKDGTLLAKNLATGKVRAINRPEYYRRLNQPKEEAQNEVYQGTDPAAE